VKFSPRLSTETVSTDFFYPKKFHGFFVRLQFQGKGDDFYNSIFYFSGMGNVIGNALAQGVYVSEQNRRNAIDPDDVGAKTGMTVARQTPPSGFA